MNNPSDLCDKIGLQDTWFIFVIENSIDEKIKGFDCSQCFNITGTHGEDGISRGAVE